MSENDAPAPLCKKSPIMYTDKPKSGKGRIDHYLTKTNKTKEEKEIVPEESKKEKKEKKKKRKEKPEKEERKHKKQEVGKLKAEWINESGEVEPDHYDTDEEGEGTYVYVEYNTFEEETTGYYLIHAPEVTKKNHQKLAKAARNYPKYKDELETMLAKDKWITIFKNDETGESNITTFVTKIYRIMAIE